MWFCLYFLENTVNSVLKFCGIATGFPTQLQLLLLSSKTLLITDSLDKRILSTGPKPPFLELLSPVCLEFTFTHLIWTKTVINLSVGSQLEKINFTEILIFYTNVLFPCKPFAYLCFHFLSSFYTFFIIAMALFI